MPEIPDDLGLPRFARDVGVFASDAERRSSAESPSAGVLPPFDGVLDVTVDRSGRPWPDLTYLALEPLVYRTLEQSPDGGQPSDPDVSPARDPTDGPETADEPTVGEVIRQSTDDADDGSAGGGGEARSESAGDATATSAPSRPRVDVSGETPPDLSTLGVGQFPDPGAVPSRPAPTSGPGDGSGRDSSAPASTGSVSPPDPTGDAPVDPGGGDGRPGSATTGGPTPASPDAGRVDARPEPSSVLGDSTSLPGGPSLPSGPPLTVRRERSRHGDPSDAGQVGGVGRNDTSGADWAGVGGVGQTSPGSAGQTGPDGGRSAGDGERPGTPGANHGDHGDGPALDPTSLLEGATGERDRFVDELHRVLSRRRAIERDRGGG